MFLRIPGKYFPVYKTLYVRPGFPHSRRFARFMKKLRSSGILMKWKGDITRINNVENSSSSIVQVNIDHVKIILVSFILFLFLICILVLIEMRMQIRNIMNSRYHSRYVN